MFAGVSRDAGFAVAAMSMQRGRSLADDIWCK